MYSHPIAETTARETDMTDAYGLKALTAAYAEPESFAIVDPSDFCRACKGKGSTYSYEPSVLPPYRMTDRYAPCWLCGGTGNRTVKVS